MFFPSSHSNLRAAIALTLLLIPNTVPQSCPSSSVYYTVSRVRSSRANPCFSCPVPVVPRAEYLHLASTVLAPYAFFCTVSCRNSLNPSPSPYSPETNVLHFPLFARFRLSRRSKIPKDTHEDYCSQTEELAKMLSQFSRRGKVGLLSHFDWQELHSCDRIPYHYSYHHRLFSSTGR